MKSLRPYQTDAVIAAVASQTAADLMRIVDVVREGETREQTQARITSQILDTRHDLRHGGPYAARVLAERVGFTPYDEIAELLDGFDASVTSLVSKNIREWVMESKPSAPFTEAAYATLSDEEARLRGHPPGTKGIAYRTDDLDRSAYARFVPEKDFAAFVALEGKRGAGLVSWEGIASIRAIEAGVENMVFETAERHEKERLYRSRVSARPKASPSTDPMSPEEFRKPILEAMEKAKEALNGSDEAAAYEALDDLRYQMAIVARLRDEGKLRLTDEAESVPGPRR